jgi:hypothetical protein
VVYCDPEIELYLGFIYCGMVDFFSVEYVAWVEVGVDHNLSQFEGFVGGRDGVDVILHGYQ